MVLLLGGDAKRLAAGDEDPQTPAARQQVGELRRGVEELLEVVEQEQELLRRAMCSASSPLRAEHLGDRVHHERGVTNRGERDPPDAAGEALRDLGRRLSGEPGLPVPPGPVSVSIRLVREQADHLGELALTTEERRRRHGQIRLVERAQRAGTSPSPSW